VRDHVRRKFGRAPKGEVAAGGATTPSKGALHNNAGQLDEDIEQRLIKSVGVTTQLTVGEILTFVARTFSAEEVRAVELHYGEGRDYAEIASVLGLQEPLEAKRLLRRLNARLRYRFAEQAEQVDTPGL
jgi:DNA-directed RNA polymerase specialized sigma24 family protein